VNAVLAQTPSRSGRSDCIGREEARPGKSFVDLERGIYYRKPIGKKETNKLQPPAPIPPRLLAHMRRRDRLGIAVEHFVEYNGKPVLSVKKAFRTVVKLCKLGLSEGNVTPHTLRHTAATWLMQAGMDLWVAAGNLGMRGIAQRTTKKPLAALAPGRPFRGTYCGT